MVLTDIYYGKNLISSQIRSKLKRRVLFPVLSRWAYTGVRIMMIQQGSTNKYTTSVIRKDLNQC